MRYGWKAARQKLAIDDDLVHLDFPNACFAHIPCAIDVYI
jgi:hypothetical protein